MSKRSIFQNKKLLHEPSFFGILSAMVKKVDVAGIQIDNYTVREMLIRLDKAMAERSFTSMEEINMDILRMAKEDELVKQSLDALDYTIVADVGILRAASAESMQRKHEIEDHDFFYELLKRLERNAKTLFLLGENDDELEQAQEFIKSFFAKINIIGRQSSISSGGRVDDDVIVNEINAAAPDVVLSFLPSPMQEKFFLANRDKIMAVFWYAVGNTKFMDKRTGPIGRLMKFIDIRRLTKTIEEYEKQEER